MKEIKKIKTPLSINRHLPLKKGEVLIKEIIKVLKKRNWTIGVMESCTGGAIVDSITNIPGISEVFKSGKVTYSNEAKIEAGVDQRVIQSYGVYSIEVAEDMARKIGGEVGIGVTGEFPGMVYMAVRIKDEIKSNKMKVGNLIEDKIKARKEMKREVVEKVWKMIIEELER